MDRKDIHNSSVPEVCKSCEARHRGVCGALNAEQLTRLNNHTRQIALSRGETFVTEAPDGRYANILNGVMKLSQLMEDGRQQIVGLQFAPDFVGRPFQDHAAEEGVTSVEAATELTVCTFPRKVLEEMVTEAPDLGLRLYAQSLRELDDARQWMTTLGRKTAYEKVSSFLFLVARNTNPEIDHQVEFELPLTRAESADFLGLTLETVSRQMTALRKEGIIEIKGSRRVKVCDIDALERATAN